MGGYCWPCCPTGDVDISAIDISTGVLLWQNFVGGQPGELECDSDSDLLMNAAQGTPATRRTTKVDGSDGSTLWFQSAGGTDGYDRDDATDQHYSITSGGASLQIVAESDGEYIVEDEWPADISSTSLRDVVGDPSQDFAYVGGTSGGNPLFSQIDDTGRVDYDVELIDWPLGSQAIDLMRYAGGSSAVVHCRITTSNPVNNLFDDVDVGLVKKSDGTYLGKVGGGTPQCYDASGTEILTVHSRGLSADEVMLRDLAFTLDDDGSFTGIADYAADPNGGVFVIRNSSQTISRINAGVIQWSYSLAGPAVFTSLVADASGVMAGFTGATGPPSTGTVILNSSGSLVATVSGRVNTGNGYMTASNVYILNIGSNAAYQCSRSTGALQKTLSFSTIPGGGTNRTQIVSDDTHVWMLSNFNFPFTPLVHKFTISSETELDNDYWPYSPGSINTNPLQFDSMHLDGDDLWLGASTPTLSSGDDVRIRIIDKTDASIQQEYLDAGTPSPSRLDVSPGTSVSGAFLYTAKNGIVEIDGDYLYACAVPLKLAAPEKVVYSSGSDSFFLWRDGKLYEVSVTSKGIDWSATADAGTSFMGPCRIGASSDYYASVRRAVDTDGAGRSLGYVKKYNSSGVVQWTNEKIGLPQNAYGMSVDGSYVYVTHSVISSQV